MELTKEYFDEKLSELVTKDHLDKRLGVFATREDLLELPTKNDLHAVRSDIAEVKALVKTMDRRDDEDIRAIARDVADLNRRVSALER